MTSTDVLRNDHDVRRTVPNQYSELLQPSCNGHALWAPRKTTGGGGALGDVGYIRDGSFWKEGNVYVDPPCSIQPLDVPTAGIYRDEHFHMPIMQSSTSSTVSFHITGSATPAALPLTSISVEPQIILKQKRMAFLAPPIPTVQDSVSLANETAFCDWLTDNRHRLDPNLVVLTHTVRSSGWIGGVVTGRDTNASVSVSGGLGAVANLGVGASVEREVARLALTQGPRPAEWSEHEAEYTLVVRFIRMRTRIQRQLLKMKLALSLGYGRHSGFANAQTELARATATPKGLPPDDEGGFSAPAGQQSVAGEDSEDSNRQTFEQDDVEYPNEDNECDQTILDAILDMILDDNKDLDFAMADLRIVSDFIRKYPNVHYASRVRNSPATYIRPIFVTKTVPSPDGKTVESVAFITDLYPNVDLEVATEATEAVVQYSEKCFDIVPLSSDTFLVPNVTDSQQPSWSEDNQYTGRVNCPILFSTRPLCDDVDDLHRFPGDADESSGLYGEALPTGVNTVLTQCSSLTCDEGQPCYSIFCPFRMVHELLDDDPASEPPMPVVDDWAEHLPPDILATLTDADRRRQDLIRELLRDEEEYNIHLDSIDSYYIKGVMTEEVIPEDYFEQFVEDVFNNISELRRCNKRLLENLTIRKREQAPIIQWIGDVFLAIAQEFRAAYPTYISHIEQAEKRLQDEMKSNKRFKNLIDEYAEGEPDSPALQQLLHLPSKRLSQYPIMLDKILKETDKSSPDVDFLVEAIQSLRRVEAVTLLRSIQLNGSKTATWHQLVSPEIKATVPKKEQERQALIFELIQTESGYVHDLELLSSLFIRPLCTIDPPIINRKHTMEFIQNVFYNINELLKYHRKLLDDLHALQREEHPVICSISIPMLDAALNWRDAYMEYISHYPILLYHLEEEIVNNPAFKRFVDEAKNHPDARKLDIRSFISRPIPGLLKYELILKNMLRDTPPGHTDHADLEQICDILRDLGISSQHGAVASKRKVDLWRYTADLVFQPGDYVPLDLADETRSIAHASQLYFEPRGGAGWREVFVILFDHYLVITTKQEMNGVTKYQVKQRPWLLELVTIGNFDQDPPVQFSKLSSGSRLGLSPAADRSKHSVSDDSCMMFPCTIYHQGKVEEKITLYADNLQARNEWGVKLEDAIGLRVAVSDIDRAFKMKPIAPGRFFVPGKVHPMYVPDDTPITSKITCAVPFTSPDGRSLIAIGCAEGVWIGIRSKAQSLRLVLHQRNVTQCAFLPEFGTFLVLADKDIWAYDIESMVPSSLEKQQFARPREKLNKRDVFWFRVGQYNNRTLLVFMTKKLLDSVFHVLEPVSVLSADSTNLRHSASMRKFRTSIVGNGRRNEWFRPYAEFQLPCDGYDVFFLNNNFMVVLSARGFEIMIMDGQSCEGIRIPVLNTQVEPALSPIQKRIDAAKPLGIFRARSNTPGPVEAEFLLCYNDFGIYIDRDGHLSRTGESGRFIRTGEVFIEWEGAVERVVCHPPHVLLFSPRFIEVRTLDACRIVQVIKGTDLTCLWDDAEWAAKANALAGPIAPGEEGWSPEARVDCARRDPGERPGQQVLQVYELLPTLSYVATPM